MAEGGFDNENPWLDHDLDHDDDDDDEDEINTTRPFQQGTASTPYHNGEAHEMHTLPREQSGLPDTSFDENIPLINPDEFLSADDQQKEIDKTMNIIEKDAQMLTRAN